MIRGQAPAWHSKEVELRINALRFYPPSGSAVNEQRRLEDEHFSRMFVDDVASGLFPIHGRRHNKDVVVLGIEGVAQFAVLQKLVVDAFGYDDHHHGDGGFAETFAGWARWCVETVVRNGVASYELAYAWPARREEPIAFAVVPIRSGVVRRRYFVVGDFVQVVPEGAQAVEFRVPEGRRMLHAQYVELPSADVVRVQLPKHLRYLNDTVRKLKLLSENRYPEFLLPRPGERKRVPGDFGEFKRTNDRALAASTRDSGWNARLHFDEWQTEYYSMHRFLRFERMKCQLRQWVLDVANEMLSRVGPRLGFRATVTAHGLPTLSDVADAEAQLWQGTETYKALLARFYLYRHA